MRSLFFAPQTPEKYDTQHYEVALDAVREVLKKHGFDEEVVDSRRPDQIVQAVYENCLGIEYQTAFERKINVEFGKAKRNGQPSAALMLAAHEIMHAVDKRRFIARRRCRENWNDITYRKRKNADTITYQKTYPDGTVLYVEEI